MYYRFHLEKYHPGSKLECPSCKHKKCFTKYVDEEGQITFPDYVGRCDRQDKCKYHYSPKDFFHENPDMKEKADYMPKMSVVPVVHKVETSTPSFIPDSIMERSLVRYDVNPLFRFLEKKFGHDECLRLFKLYHIGTSRMWGGATVFWQTDEYGRLRTGKIMEYNPDTGHRVKIDGVGRVSYAHSALHIKNFRLKQCLFGEHLLDKEKAKTVFLVESEKSAIVAFHFMPYYIWLATGGKTVGFHADTLQVLCGRNVILLPDLKAEDEWREKLPLFQSICKSASVSNMLVRRATPEQYEAGLDIADFLLMEKMQREIVQELLNVHPEMQILIDKLKLELVE